MLCQVCKPDLFKDEEGYQEVSMTFSISLTVPRLSCSTPDMPPSTFIGASSPMHTFVISIPTVSTNLSKVSATDQHKVHLYQSIPYRMREPLQQAKFYKTFATLLFYIVSGKSLVSYMDKSEENPYYKEMTGFNVSIPRQS
jgi:hypothetical protein